MDKTILTELSPESVCIPHKTPNILILLTVAGHSSRKHVYIILTPLNPTFIYGKIGVYRGIHYFFLFLLKNIDCAHNLCFCRGGSNEYPQSTFLSRNMKKIRLFIRKLSFLVAKFSIYWLVFVMFSSISVASSFARSDLPFTKANFMDLNSAVI